MRPGPLVRLSLVAGIELFRVFANLVGAAGAVHFCHVFLGVLEKRFDFLRRYFDVVLETEQTVLEPKRLVAADTRAREQRVAGGWRWRGWRGGVGRGWEFRQIERVEVPMKHRRPVYLSENDRLGPAGEVPDQGPVPRLPGREGGGLPHRDRRRADQAAVPPGHGPVWTLTGCHRLPSTLRE